jgi:hypothetical protein
MRGAIASQSVRHEAVGHTAPPPQQPTQEPRGNGDPEGGCSRMSRTSPSWSTARQWSI